MADSAADILALAERLARASARGDNEEIARCYAPDARIWRNFDGQEQTIEDMFKVSRWINKKLTNRVYKVQRREAIPGGYVQQHVMTGTLANGDIFELPAMLVALVEDGRITRVEEYLDSVQADKLRG
jgi:ketosteroid isomerase-like protein